MPRLASVDMRRARAIVDALETVRVGEGPVLEAVLPRLRELLDADASMSYGLLPRGDALSVDFVRAVGFSAETYARDFGKVLEARPVGWGAYNPLRPEQRQRNVVRSIGPDVPLAMYDRIPESAPLVENHRFMLECEQLRVLVCEGPVMLAWFGVLRRRAYGARERTLLRRLIPALHRRLSLERATELASVAWPGFHAAMERVAGPVYLARAPDVVVHANAGGRAALARDMRGTRAAVAEALRGTGTRLEVTPVLAGEGVPRHWLVRERPPPADPVPRAARLARELSLTSRQAEVLAQLAAGKANKTIAALLGCAEVTVELHVTALLSKLGCENRAEAVARFWTA